MFYNAKYDTNITHNNNNNEHSLKATQRVRAAKLIRLTHKKRYNCT